MRPDCSGLLLVDLALPHGEAFPVGIGEAIHAVNALHPLDVNRQSDVFCQLYETLKEYV